MLVSFLSVDLFFTAGRFRFTNRIRLVIKFIRMVYFYIPYYIRISFLVHLYNIYYYLYFLVYKSLNVLPISFFFFFFFLIPQHFTLSSRKGLSSSSTFC